MVQHSSIDHTGITGAGGSVATDSIWDATGDLAVGTGANTAAKLAVGSNAGYALTSRGTGLAPWWAQSSGGLADQGTFTYLDATEAAAPSTPASGKVRIYAKSDGRIYSKDDGGVEYGPFSSGGGGGPLTLAGYSLDVYNLSPGFYARLNEPHASNGVVDYSGNGNHLLTAGTLTQAQAALIVGDATAGSTDFGGGSLKAVDHASLDLGDVFSIVAVIRPDSVSGQHGIVTKENSAYYLRTNGTNLELLRTGIAVVCTSTGVTLSTATTYHVAATKNGATIKLYVNGVDRTGSTSNSTMANNTNQLLIGVGDNGGSEPFDGRIAEVALFPTALSAGDITALFTASGI